jgi:hypothetical protein
MRPAVVLPALQSTPHTFLTEPPRLVPVFLLLFPLSPFLPCLRSPRTVLGVSLSLCPTWEFGDHSPGGGGRRAERPRGAQGSAPGSRLPQRARRCQAAAADRDFACSHWKQPGFFFFFFFLEEILQPSGLRMPLPGEALSVPPTGWKEGK